MKYELFSMIPSIFRPSFEDLYNWLEALVLHMEMGTPVPSPLQGDPLLTPSQEGPILPATKSLPLINDHSVPGVICSGHTG